MPFSMPEAVAEAHIRGICLKTGPPRLVGVELEWLVRDVDDPALPVPAERISAAMHAYTGHPQLPSSSAPGRLPSGASLTTEPGGQLELSSPPADSLAECVRTTAADLALLRSAAAAAGLELAGLGLDPYRPPRRILDLPRYAAMEAFFDSGGPWGRQMMCATASVQVCVDAGDDSDGVSGYRYRWRLLHAIGPVLVAAFANSPLRDGKPTGWRSSRQQVWANMDAGRTRPPVGDCDWDLRAGWAAYALDAQLMCVRSESADWSAPPGLTLREWVRGTPRLRRTPTTEDLGYHLTTLFPPVRPRGHLEIRMIDAQPGDGWVVPTAVVWALLGDARAADRAMAAVERLWHGRPAGEWPAHPGEAAYGVTGVAGVAGVAGASEAYGAGEAAGNPWLRAAVCGPDDPEIAAASRECFAAARDALRRQQAPAAIRDAVDAFAQTYVAHDRCPADDLLEEIT